MGNWSRVLFWHDVCGEQLLEDHFPDLFRMARFKDATLNHVVSWNGDHCHWNIIFSRSPNDWEEGSVLSLLALLAYSKVELVGDDMILYSTKKSTIKSFYGEVCKDSSFIDFPAWRSKAPLKACFFGLGSYQGESTYRRDA